MSGLLPDGCTSVNDALAWAAMIYMGAAALQDGESEDGFRYGAYLSARGQRMLNHLRQREYRRGAHDAQDDMIRGGHP